MIIVTGSAVARPDAFDALLHEARVHVARSRREEGCISHEVSNDVDNPLRLVFLERWRDRDALAAHFALSESNAFVKALRSLTAEPPTMDIYTVAPTSD